MVSEALVEGRTEYAVGTIIFLLRWFTRWRTVSLGDVLLDEIFALSAWMFSTLLFAMVEFLAVMGAPIALTQEQREALPDTTKTSMQEGAKGMFASFFFLTMMIWSLKGCLIMLFFRLTKGTRLHTYVVVVAAISVVSCTAAIVTQLTHCLPLHRNWQILPDPGKECSAGVITNIVIAVGNVTTDTLLLIVTVSLLKDMQTAMRRKLKIGFLLSLGVFVMAMAITRCILSIGSSVQVAQASVWAQRETVVSIFAVNAPLINALFKVETWRPKKAACSCYYSCQHSPLGSSARSKQSRSNSRKVELDDLAGIDIETRSKESTSELVSSRAY